MLFSRALRHSALGAVVAVLALSCKDKPVENAVDAAPTPPAVASSVAPASSTGSAPPSSARLRDENRGQGGPNGMLFKAARALELKDEQKAKIDAAEKSARSAPPDAGEGALDARMEASKGLHTELIAAVKAGKIDAAKLEPHYVAIEKVTAAGHQKQAEALTALHAALEPAQRKAVAAAVRAKADEWDDLREDMEERKTEHVHNVIDAGGSDAGFTLGGTRRTLDRLTRGVELDADQQKKLDAIATKEDATKASRAGSDEMKKRMEALLAAFEKDTFDAKKLDLFDAKKARAPMEYETKLLTQILAVLKPEQREKLAAKMETAPSQRGRRGGPGGRGRGDGGGGGGGGGD